MFRYKQQKSSSSASEHSQASSNSDASISHLTDLLQKIQFEVEEVQQRTLPSLQADLAKVQKKISKLQSKKPSHRKNRSTIAKTSSQSSTLQDDFQPLLINEKWGIKTGQTVTITNKVIVKGYTVPTRYTTGTVDDFTIRFVVVLITYPRGGKTYKAKVYRDIKNIAFE